MDGYGDREMAELNVRAAKISAKIFLWGCLFGVGVWITDGWMALAGLVFIMAGCIVVALWLTTREILFYLQYEAGCAVDDHSV